MRPEYNFLLPKFGALIVEDQSVIVAELDARITYDQGAYTVSVDKMIHKELHMGDVLRLLDNLRS